MDNEAIIRAAQAMLDNLENQNEQEGEDEYDP